MSKPIERCDTGEQDLFRSRLDHMIDTTVQPKNVMFPTDARLIHRARVDRTGLDGDARQSSVDSLAA